MIFAGRLNRRVILQSRQSGQDAIGQALTAWIDGATVWANIRHGSGAEAIKASADVSTTRASIRIRRRAGINAGMRVNASGVIYEIKAVLPDENGEYIDLVCEVFE